MLHYNINKYCIILYILQLQLLLGLFETVSRGSAFYMSVSRRLILVCRLKPASYLLFSAKNISSLVFTDINILNTITYKFIIY
jgi:hypothetical protein